VKVCTFIISARIPLLSSLLKIIGSIYAAIVRIGIPGERIKVAQESDAMETVRNWQEKQEEKK